MSNKSVERKVAVFSNGINGPEIFFVKVRATDEQVGGGEHFKSAQAFGYSKEYDAFSNAICFDESKPPHITMFSLLCVDWSGVVTINCGGSINDKDEYVPGPDPLEYGTSYPYSMPPWGSSRDAVPAGIVQTTIYSNTGERVATVFGSEGNVNLIKAAPAMAKALDDLATMAERRDNVMGDPLALLDAKANIAASAAKARQVLLFAVGEA